MKCTRCGWMNNDSDKFCRNCGAKMTQRVQNASVPQNNGYIYSSNHMAQGNTPQNAGTQQNVGIQPDFNTQYYNVGTPQKHVKKEGNVLGVISMICGIAALVFFWVIIPGWVCGTVAIILGIIQCVAYRNKGMGITGLVTGGLAFVASTAFFIVALLSDDATTEDGSAIFGTGQDYALHVSYQTISTDIGSFELMDGWSEDSISTQSSDGCVYAPDGAQSDKLSDYIYLGGIDSDLTYDSRDELIQMNVDAIIEEYPDITENDIIVTTETGYEAPAVSFEYTAYSDYYEDYVHVFEKYLMYDGALVAGMSYDFDTWDNDILSPEEIMNHILETFKVSRGY